MLKIIGSILIIGGSVACGIKGVFYLRERVNCLRSIITSLSVMESEICDRLTPVPELMEMLEKEAPEPARELFISVNSLIGQIGEKTFSDIWRQAIARTPQLLLSPQETLALSELGFALGKYNIEQQKSAFAHTKARMESFLDQAERQQTQNSKVSAFVGLASGMLAVIVLI